MKFSELGLKPEILAGLQKLKYESPTEVQEKSLQPLLQGKDLVVRSKTGSGKTFAFLLPILQNLTPENTLQALILSPTRELAQQTDKEAHKLLPNIKTVLLYGGVSITPQMDKLDRGAQIAVATPGRVLDHMARGSIDFSNIRFVVLDEADRMLDMGFIDDVEKILRATPKQRQTMLFSATMPDQVVRISQRYMNNPETLMLQQDEITVKKIRQRVLGVDRKLKLDLLMKILRDKDVHKVMIFCNTKDWAERMGNILWKKRFKATSIHSGLSQNKRNQVINDFNNGRYNILVATDVAARGLHIEGVTHVVNYDIPRNPKDYVHRIGRTGRAGKEGDAITFVTQIDEHLLRAVESEIKMFLEVQHITPEGKILTPPRDRSHLETPQHTPLAHGLKSEEVKLHTHSDSSGDDWGLD
jgi:ATP-dependent RNA helicase DeaD